MRILRCMARLVHDSTARECIAAVMIYSDNKRDAQDAICLSKAWLRDNGFKYKLVYFYEIYGTQWSNLGRSYKARIIYGK